MHVGDAVLVVEGADLSPWSKTSIGVGVGGRLGLVGGRCVGFVGSDGSESVIIWPSGTDVSGPADHLSITSEGKTVRLGDQIEAGSDLGHDFSGIKALLPGKCGQADLVQVGLSS